LVISQRDRAIRLVNAVNPADRAAREGYVLALDRVHCLIVTDERGLPVYSTDEQDEL
jgi:hypothetical protein